MGKIYVGQTALRFTATLGIDVTGGTCVIKYRKPDEDETEGEWDAIIQTEATGVIYYDVEDADVVDTAGVWAMWGYATLSNGNVIAGQPFYKKVYEEGDK